MTSEKRIFQPLTSSDVCGIFDLLYKNGLVSFPLTKEGREKVDAIISSINTVYYGIDRYAAAEEKAAAYLFFLIKGHPFTDGNKRTAVLSFKIFCALNNLEPNEKEFGLDELAVYIEQTNNDHQKTIRVIAVALFGWDFLRNYPN